MSSSSSSGAFRILSSKHNYDNGHSLAIIVISGDGGAAAASADNKQVIDRLIDVIADIYQIKKFS